MRTKGDGKTAVQRSRRVGAARRPGVLLGALFALSLLAAGCGSDSELVAARQEAATAQADAAAARQEAATAQADAAVAREEAAAATAPAPLSESTVRWAGFGGMAELLFFVADDAGHFAAEGLEVERIELGGGTNLFTALASGSVAFTQLGTQHGIKAVSRGLDFRGIYGFSHGPNEFGVISPEAAAAAGVTNDSTLAEKFEALRGLKIGTGRPGSTTTTLAIGAMEQRGIDTESDVELVPLGSGGALLPAFQAREIDAFFWIPPETQIAGAEAGAVMIDFRELDELADINWAGYMTTDSYIIEHPDTVRAFIRSVLSARRWALAHEAEALEIARGRFPDLDDAVLEQSFKIDFDSLKRSILWREDGFEQGRYILNLGLPADAPNGTLMSAVVTNEFVEEAAAELGIDIE